MKVIMFYIVFIISYSNLFSQSSILYEYDSAGNRIGIIIKPSKVKIMSIDPNTVIRNCQDFEITVYCTDDNDRIQKAIEDINFEVSLNSGNGSLSPAVCNGTIISGQCSCKVVVKISAAQAYMLNNFNVYTLKLSAEGFDDYISEEISVYRYAAEPIIQVSDINASNIGQTSMQISWAAVEGYAHIVLADSNDVPFPNPEDGHGYGQFNNDIVNFVTRNKICPSCSAKLIYNGTSNSIFVQGLYPNRTYRYRVYKYNMNCSPETIKYTMTEATNNPNEFSTLLKSSEQENNNLSNFAIISLSPVPANDLLKIEVMYNATGNSTIEIFNEIGEKVYLKEYNSKLGKNILEINLRENNIIRGSYYLKIIDSEFKMQESSFVVK